MNLSLYVSSELKGWERDRESNTESTDAQYFWLVTEQSVTQYLYLDTFELELEVCVQGPVDLSEQNRCRYIKMWWGTFA